MFIVLDRSRDAGIVATPVEDDGTTGSPRPLTAGELTPFVAAEERAERPPRWVWLSTPAWYPRLLADGVRISRCFDLALCERILHSSTLVQGARGSREPLPAWASLPSDEPAQGEALFELDDAAGADAPAAVDVLTAQLATVEGSESPGRLRLLLAAESAGAAIAAEMRFAGLPWRRDVHEHLLEETLGARVAPGSRPARMEELAAAIREALDAPSLNPDSQPELLRALRREGLLVTTTRAWELRELDHPAIGPLLEYKKLARLLSANGWAWMDSWIVDDRFHPDYVAGGVVSGRWATRGGGALQLPKQIRSAVVADPGWKLVVADAAQLEPRVLSGLAGDTGMAQAGHDRDLYDGVVASGVVDSRRAAKVAMLGAMYGATTGDSAILIPRLTRAFPRALALVEAAARSGERGEVVTSRLGRSSPPPGAEWAEVQSKAASPEANAGDERRARSRSRDWGRFTRNFVVQASAAEWALCWMAETRNRLAALPAALRPGLAAAPFATSAHLVFFLHDEVIVHAPAEVADEVATIVRDAASSAGRLLFGEFPVDFPLSVRIAVDYGEASQ